MAHADARQSVVDDGSALAYCEGEIWKKEAGRDKIGGKAQAAIGAWALLADGSGEAARR